MLLAIFAATLLTTLIALLMGTTARLHAILPPNRPRPQRRRGLARSSSFSSDVRTNRSRRLERASRDGELLASPDYPYKHVMLVLGSGGHTAEMLLMLHTVRLERWGRRSWVVSSGDGFSAGLAAEFEASLSAGGSISPKLAGTFDIVELPRARKVHQSILTAPITSLICLWASARMLARDAPDVILTNGPGTGVIVVLASVLLRFFGLAGSARTRCVYVESLARCRKLSLSGRLLNGIVDRFLVQWPELEGGKAEYRGCFALDAAVEVGLKGVDEDAEVPCWIS